MKTEKTYAIIEASSTGFGIYAEDDNIPVSGYGKTVEAAKEDLRTQLAELVASYREKGEKVPAALNGGDLTFVFRYNI